MKTIDVKISEIIPYEKNPRRNDEAVKFVKNSIQEFGFLVPLVIDKYNIVVCGHTRLKAAKELGFDSLPCVRAESLTEEQIKAFRLADNKVAEKAGWNIKLLQEEMRFLPEFDFTDFGFDFSMPGENKPNERMKTYDAYNMDYIDEYTKNRWGFPDFETSNITPSRLIGFNEVLTAKKFDCGVHFYIDDYQFERIWNSPEKYIDKLAKFECVITPDFSLYMNMPLAMKIWNVYRFRTIGKILADVGIEVIPCIQFAGVDTFEFCFDGLPKHQTISISSVGVKQDKEAYEIFKLGVNECIKRLEPRKIILYGGEVKDIDFKDIEIVTYKNKRGGK